MAEFRTSSRVVRGDEEDTISDPGKPMLTSLQEELDGLEEEAAYLRSEWDDDKKADGVEKAVRDIRTAFPDLVDQAVSYELAALLEGQTVGTIRSRVSEGELTNVGTKGAGRIPLRELRGSRLLVLLLYGSLEADELVNAE